MSVQNTMTLGEKIRLGEKIGLVYNESYDGYLDAAAKIAYIYDAQWKIAEKKTGKYYYEQVFEYIEDAPGVFHGEWKVNEKFAGLNGWNIVEITIITNHDLDYFDICEMDLHRYIKDGKIIDRDRIKGKRNPYYANRLDEWNCEYIYAKDVEGLRRFRIDWDDLSKEVKNHA